MADTVKIAGITLDGDRALGAALQTIDGIGPKRADKICTQTGLAADHLVRDLTGAEAARLHEYVEEHYKHIGINHPNYVGPAPESGPEQDTENSAVEAVLEAMERKDISTALSLLDKDRKLAGTDVGNGRILADEMAYEAVRQGHEEGLWLARDFGANTADPRLLRAAVQGGEPDVMRKLIRNMEDAGVGIPEDMGEILRQDAETFQHPEMADLFNELVGRTQPPESEVPFPEKLRQALDAFAGNDLARARELLQENPGIPDAVVSVPAQDPENPERRTNVPARFIMMHHAINNGSEDAVQLAEDYGAKIDNPAFLGAALAGNNPQMMRRVISVLKENEVPFPENTSEQVRAAARSLNRENLADIFDEMTGQEKPAEASTGPDVATDEPAAEPDSASEEPVAPEGEPESFEKAERRLGLVAPGAAPPSANSGKDKKTDQMEGWAAFAAAYEALFGRAPPVQWETAITRYRQTADNELSFTVSDGRNSREMVMTRGAEGAPAFVGMTLKNGEDLDETWARRMVEMARDAGMTQVGRIVDATPEQERLLRKMIDETEGMEYVGDIQPEPQQQPGEKKKPEQKEEQAETTPSSKEKPLWKRMVAPLVIGGATAAAVAAMMMCDFPGGKPEPGAKVSRTAATEKPQTTPPAAIDVRPVQPRIPAELLADAGDMDIVNIIRQDIIPAGRIDEMYRYIADATEADPNFMNKYLPNGSMSIPTAIAHAAVDNHDRLGGDKVADILEILGNYEAANLARQDLVDKIVLNADVDSMGAVAAWAIQKRQDVPLGILYGAARFDTGLLEWIDAKAGPYADIAQEDVLAGAVAGNNQDSIEKIIAEYAARGKPVTEDLVHNVIQYADTRNPSNAIQTMQRLVREIQEYPEYTANAALANHLYEVEQFLQEERAALTNGPSGPKFSS